MASSQPLADARYLLSPGDLYALRQIPEIVEIGISALKIEGRYKDADYVALTTRAYREAVDDAWAGRPLEVDRARRAAARTGLFARPGSVLSERHESPGGGERPRAAASRRADGTRVARVGRGRRRSSRPKRTRSPRSSPAMAWSSMRPTGAVPRSPKRAAASFEVKAQGKTLEAAVRQWRDPCEPHPRAATWSGARTIPRSTRPRAPIWNRPPRCASSRCAFGR